MSQDPPARAAPPRGDGPSEGPAAPPRAGGAAVGRSASTRLQQIVFGASLVAPLLVAVRVALRPDYFQWDFYAYYHAARAFLEGRDFYERTTLDAIIAASNSHGVFSNLFFVYPPHSLLWFLPFSSLPARTAYYVYLAVNVGALAAFVALGRSWLRDPWLRAGFPSIAAFFLNNATMMAIGSGNVALFECVFVLAAFAALVRGRAFTFGWLLALAASCKGVVVSFLAVPFLGGPRRSFTRAIAGAMILPAVALGFALTFPAVYARYGAASSGSFLQLLIEDRGSFNASAFQLFAEISRLLFGTVSLALVLPLYAAWILFVIAGTWPMLRAQRVPLPTLAIRAIFTYVLLMPRMKDYSYVIAVVPCLSAIEGMTDRWRMPLLIYGMLPYDLLFSRIPGLDNPFQPSVWRLPFAYSALVVTTLCWFRTRHPPDGVLIPPPEPIAPYPATHGP